MRFLMGVVSDSRPPLKTSVGRVGLKLEAAGKSRLFMILDSISQRLLQPLLAAGRGRPLPVGVIGVLNGQLQESWLKRLEGPGGG